LNSRSPSSASYRACRSIRWANATLAKSSLYASAIVAMIHSFYSVEVRSAKTVFKIAGMEAKEFKGNNRSIRSADG
jgi:hypothetical protein